MRHTCPTCNGVGTIVLGGEDGDGDEQVLGRAAKTFADELQRPMHRVDLSAILDKYVGQTERILDRLLTEAEQLDSVLLLDEGDALLGRRTEVRSAHDRYADLETNFLLQRLEEHVEFVLVLRGRHRPPLEPPEPARAD